MAVSVRISARGVPQRMAAACFPIASNPYRAFGGWYHRVTNTNGTVPQPAQGPNVAGNRYAVPPGPTSHNSRNVRVFVPQWSIVRPSLPRNAPWAGQIPHGIPNVTYTPAIAQPNAGQTPNTNARAMRLQQPRGPIAQGRVTTNPRPMFSWKKQGG